MRENFELTAETRNDKGKGASRRLRHANKVPGIMYGGGKTPANLSLDHNELIRHLEHEAFYSHILTVKVDGQEEKAVLRDLQRHPSKPRILHLDLQRVSATEKLRMRIPLHFVGTEIAPGVKQSGGIVSHLLNDVEVSCLAADLPEYIEADLTNLKLGETIHLSDLKLPQGVELVALGHAHDDRPVATIHLPRAAVEETAAPVEQPAPEAITAKAEAKPEAKGGKAEGK
ncbi:MAG TPA: 50S ribosomal protein L25/general stress protein Ctc [Gammaproteobacteria bacterium]|nr:50S ribosomal protein L25/general stress protein Ctc [Gammaproteobacteria bacterium]